MVLSFLSWQIGLLLWLFWRNTRPGKAGSAAHGAAAGASFTMPVLGFALWALWRNDPRKSEYARTAVKAAIVGVAIYAVLIAASVILRFTGVSMDDYTIPVGDMAAAFINTLAL